MIERRILYLSEVVQFFCQSWMKFLLTGLFAFTLTFAGVLLLKPPTFAAVATFKQGSNGEDEMGSVQAFLKSIQGEAGEAVAAGIMQSRMLLSRAVKRVGLQTARVGFSDVEFVSKEAESFTLIPIDERRYEVVGQGEGTLGNSFVCERVGWTLDEMPKGPITIRLMPMRKLLPKIQKQLKIRKSRIDAKLLNLTFCHRQRALAIAFVDELMEQYISYLEREHERIALAQIAYLQKRRDRFISEFEGNLDDHVTYLKSAGNIGLSQEIQLLSEPKEIYLAKKHDLDLELKKWRGPDLTVAVEHPWKEGLLKRDQLSLKRAMLLGEEGPAEEYEGIDLGLAEGLFNASASERDRLTQEVSKIERVLEKLDQENIPISNLGGMLDDPVSRSIIAQASELTLQIADRENYSTRELCAKVEALEMQRGYLKGHLEKQKGILIDRLDLLCEKLIKLRGTALDLIERERGGIELKLKEIGDQMEEIPGKWRRERGLEMKRELTMQIMEGLSQLSESKVIHHHLFHIESRPLDRADAPLEPRSRLLFPLSSMGGICGGFVFFLFSLMRAFSKGLPVSSAYLLERRYHLVEGSAQVDKVALHVGPNEVVALIGVGFADDLFQLLKRRGYVVNFQEMPSNLFEWKRPNGCLLIKCEGEREEIDSLLVADRFVIGALGKRPKDLEIFPKDRSFVLL